MISFEQFCKVLYPVGGKPSIENPKPEEFDRCIEIETCSGVKVVFEWYKNLMNAYIYDVQITWFDELCINRCFPEKGVHLRAKQGKETIAVFKIGE